MTDRERGEMGAGRGEMKRRGGSGVAEFEIVLFQLAEEGEIPEFGGEILERDGHHEFQFVCKLLFPEDQRPLPDKAAARVERHHDDIVVSELQRGDIHHRVAEASRNEILDGLDVFELLRSRLLAIRIYLRIKELRTLRTTCQRKEEEEDSDEGDDSLSLFHTVYRLTEALVSQTVPREGARACGG